MHTDIDKMLDLMERAFIELEYLLPSKPQLKDLPSGPAYRFKEKNIYQAMIQKLARVQSLVKAARLLLSNGFFQEQSILHRVIDETNEDIIFLLGAILNKNITDLHRKFLEAFWEEEIDESGTIITSNQKRPMVPRKKIQAYLAKLEGDSDPSTHQKLARTVSKVYSGFVHGASPHIMEMYGGSPPRFHTSGMMGTPRGDDYSRELWNYVYRSFLSHIAVAKAFGAEKQAEVLYKYLAEFENNAGM
jgi:hypothetical protein